MRLSGLEVRSRSEEASIQALRLSKQQAGERSARIARELEAANAEKEQCLERISRLEARSAEAEKDCERQGEKIKRQIEIQHADALSWSVSPFARRLRLKRSKTRKAFSIPVSGTAMS